MGTDIHTVFQAKRGKEWVDVKSKFEENRHYFLFSWLADVRNGYGVAGVPTYDPVVPLAKPRGLPKDFTVEDDDTAHNGKWLGDHSHSWLTADEILGATPPNKGVMRTGVITVEQFKRWDGKAQPDNWAGSISGRGIEVAASPRLIGPTTTHVTIEWAMPGDELTYFTDEVQRLKQEYGEVRVVFGFDS